MKNKTILGSWCTEPNCKFIDSKHIQIELLAHIWYSYDSDSKTDVINKKLCFVKDIDFDILNDEVEILEEEKEIPLKINKIIPSQNYVISDSKNNSVDERLEIIRKRLYANELYMLDIANTLNEIIDYLKSKGE